MKCLKATLLIAILASIRFGDSGVVYALREQAVDIRMYKVASSTGKESDTFYDVLIEYKNVIPFGSWKKSDSYPMVEYYAGNVKLDVTRDSHRLIEITIYGPSALKKAIGKPITCRYISGYYLQSRCGSLDLDCLVKDYCPNNTSECIERINIEVTEALKQESAPPSGLILSSEMLVKEEAISQTELRKIRCEIMSRSENDAESEEGDKCIKSLAK